MGDMKFIKHEDTLLYMIDTVERLYHKTFNFKQINSI